MGEKSEKAEINGEPFDYADDFSFLTPKEKRVVLKNAKHLLKLQKKNVDMADDADSSEE